MSGDGATVIVFDVLDPACGTRLGFPAVMNDETRSRPRGVRPETESGP